MACYPKFALPVKNGRTKLGYGVKVAQQILILFV
jgi:hypothetical protein